MRPQTTAATSSKLVRSQLVLENVPWVGNRKSYKNEWKMTLWTFFLVHVKLLKAILLTASAIEFMTQSLPENISALTNPMASKFSFMSWNGSDIRSDILFEPSQKFLTRFRSHAFFSHHFLYAMKYFLSFSLIYFFMNVLGYLFLCSLSFPCYLKKNIFSRFSMYYTWFGSLRCFLTSNLLWAIIEMIFILSCFTCLF